MSNNPPDVIPAAPIPVIARPTIRAAEVGAVAETMEPISNIATSVISTASELVLQVDRMFSQGTYPIFLSRKSNISDQYMSRLLCLMGIMWHSRRYDQRIAEACKEAIRSLLRTMQCLQNC